MLKMNWTLSAALVAAAFAVTAPQAEAQSPTYRGAFTLPFEARFGNVVLPPGSYAIATLDNAKGIRIWGDNGKVSILAASYELGPINEKGKMILVDVDGVPALKSLESGSMGKTLHFVVPKTRGSVERAGVKQTIEVGVQ